MLKAHGLILLGVAAWFGATPAARAQARPYIGYVYPAGGQRGTTVAIRLGGQGLDGVDTVRLSGSGVTARVVEFDRRLNNQEVQLLNEQLRELKRATNSAPAGMAQLMSPEPAMMMSAAAADQAPAKSNAPAAPLALIARLEKRTREFVQTPACASLASLVHVEVAISPDAEPGERELRLATPRGVSNPLAFHVGQTPEFARKPMLTAPLQVLGKEAQALRKRPTEEIEDRVTLPCTLNGQIASGEVNRYRFAARKGQRLVIATQARQLIPFIADAVPGWFQPVLELHDAGGREMAFSDDYRFKPDPVILFEVPKDGDYVLGIFDSIYRGREDFVYRIAVGELPFVTSIFPLGAQAGGAPVAPAMKGWNLQGAALTPPGREARPGIHLLVARRKGVLSNPVPFALDSLPSGLEAEPNNTQASAQKVTLPVIVNGRIDSPGDWDVFEFAGKSNAAVVVETQARRLDSPLDSVVRVTDASGQVLAFNDDQEDLGAGVNTHPADSYCRVVLPRDGVYYAHIGDTARKGGEEYAYRLRISRPQPDFALRVTPSSVSLRGKSAATLAIYAMRKDGFAGPIRLSLKDPPAGFSAAPVSLVGTQTVARLNLRSAVEATEGPVCLSVIGSAKIGDKEVVREAVPAEDKMQAFLWRHLVPAGDLIALVFNPSNPPPPKRIAPIPPPAAPTNTVAAVEAVAAAMPAPTNALPGTNVVAVAKPKFTKQQITGRLRQLKLLYEEGLLTDSFYLAKVAECEAAP